LIRNHVKIDVVHRAVNDELKHVVANILLLYLIVEATTFFLEHVFEVEWTDVQNCGYCNAITVQISSMLDDLIADFNISDRWLLFKVFRENFLIF
jgi:hypothetical protein